MKVKFQRNLSKRTSYLPKRFNTKKKIRFWTSQEVSMLNNLVHTHNKNWKEIVKHLPGRTIIQCKLKWCRVNPNLDRHKWAPEEDKILLDLLNQYGKKWKLIGEMMGGLTGKQVRDRFINHTDPAINKNEWTEEEDEIILKNYKIVGSKWSLISKKLIGRPENMVKNRFYSYLKDYTKSQYTNEYVNSSNEENSLEQTKNIDISNEDSDRRNSPYNKKLSELSTLNTSQMASVVDISRSKFVDVNSQREIEELFGPIEQEKCPEKYIEPNVMDSSVIKNHFENKFEFNERRNNLEYWQNSIIINQWHLQQQMYYLMYQKFFDGLLGGNNGSN